MGITKDLLAQYSGPICDDHGNVMCEREHKVHLRTPFVEMCTDVIDVTTWPPPEMHRMKAAGDRLARLVLPIPVCVVDAYYDAKSLCLQLKDRYRTNRMT